jgi:hypothetical protein
MRTYITTLLGTFLLALPVGLTLLGRLAEAVFRLQEREPVRVHAEPRRAVESRPA